jgi:hypothetical protein
VAQPLDFVEIVADTAGDAELLSGGSRPAPRWLARVVTPGRRLPTGPAAAAAVVLGCLLAADGSPARHATTLPSTGPSHGPATTVYATGDRCPADMRCTAIDHPRLGMWASFDATFGTATSTRGQVTFEPSGGAVASRTLTATQPRGILIMLSQQRVATALARWSPSGVEFDVPMQWALAVAPRTVIVSAQRGEWMLTATVRGPWDGRLPIAAARKWVMSAPTPD